MNQSQFHFSDGRVGIVHVTWNSIIMQIKIYTVSRFDQQDFQEAFGNNGSPDQILFKLFDSSNFPMVPL